MNELPEEIQRMKNRNNYEPKALSRSLSQGLKEVAILGSLPPLRALSSYCLAFSLAISRLIKTEFISFKHIYPAFLYPGGGLKDDYTFPKMEQSSSMKERRYLTWYNPLSWIWEGLFTKGQVLHAQWWSSPLIFVYLTICFLYKIRRRPIVITVHNIVQHEKNYFYELCSRILFKLCDHFIVHSQANKEMMIKFFNIDRDRITFIPHGPLDFQNTGNIDRKKARRILGLKKQDRVILVFGAIRSYKGIDIALEALAKVTKAIPDARMVIAGKLWEPWDRYAKIIKENNIASCVIKHLHYIDTNEVARYFIASDLVILPYHHFESQSGVGATAVAFRKPMIVTRTGGLPALVVDNANVVPSGDIKALADRIIYCLNNQSVMEKMSKESETIAEEISWDGVAMKTLSIYEKLISKKI